MKIGIPKEKNNDESRVGLTPAGVGQLVLDGNEVYVQKGAGLATGITDEEYPAKVTGNPKNETGSPAVFNAAKLGCNNTPAIVIAKYALHLNFLAAEFASKNGKK